MSKRVLLTYFFQPFAQFRNPFTFYYGQTFPLPTFSSIYGMLMNLFEVYEREDYNELMEILSIELFIGGGYESVYWNYQNMIKGSITIGRFLDYFGWLGKNDETSRNYNVDFAPLYSKSGVKLQRTQVIQEELFNGHLFILFRGNNKIIEKLIELLYSKVLRLGRSEDLLFLRGISLVNLDESDVEFSERFSIKDFEIKPRKSSFVIKRKKLYYLSYNFVNIPVFLRENIAKVDYFYSPIYFIPVVSVFLKDEKFIVNKAKIDKNTSRRVVFDKFYYYDPNYAGSLMLNKVSEIFSAKIKINNDVFLIEAPEEGWVNGREELIGNLSGKE